MASISLSRFSPLACALTSAATPLVAWTLGVLAGFGHAAPASAAPVSAAPMSAAPGPAPLVAEPEAQRVTVPTEDKLKLAGTFYAPKDSKLRAPGVVLVHGPGGSRAELDALAIRLQKSGFAALTLDLRAHGESLNDAPAWAAMDEETRTRTWAFAARDVKAGVDFLLEQNGVHATTVSLLGYGGGAALVARQATRDERVRDLVLLAPETEKFGSTLAKDVVELSGLPILVTVAKDEAATAKRIAEAGNKAAAGEPTLETQVTKLAAGELAGDTKVAADISRWMKSKALPNAASKPSH